MSFQLSPADIVLSCTICQETLSTLYAHDDRNEGLHREGEGPNDGKVTKLWLTECAHLTCGKHLSGGGAPFHSIHDIPRAPCPLCSMDKDDHSDKALFFINGTSKGQYDENIPDAYFHIPPIQLSGGDSGLEALRFQYLSLLRSGTKIREKLVGLGKALKRWEDKKPEIVRSLSSVAPLRDELSSAGRRLIALGEDVSSIKTTLQLVGVSLTEGLHPQQQVNVRSAYHNKDLKPAERFLSHLDGGSRLARASAADLDSLNQGAGIFKGHGEIPQQDLAQRGGSSSKRKRADSRSNTKLQTECAPRGEAFEQCRSRDQMPPPPIPLQQQPFAFRARVPSSDVNSLNSQHNHVRATHNPVTPQRHTSGVGLSRLLLVPESSMEPSNRLSPGNRTNSGQSHLNHHRAIRDDTGTERPVYVRGGWQRPSESSDTERSGYFSSPSFSLPSTAQPPIRRSMTDHKRSLMFPIELGDRTIESSSRSYQSASSDGSSSYPRRQSVSAMQSQLESPTYSDIHKPSPNRECRITLLRTPSLTSRHLSNKSVGLSSHVRSSGRQTSHQLANSGFHRQQLMITAPAHQRLSASALCSTRQPAYNISLPSLGEPSTQVFRQNHSFDSGLTPVNGEMRSYSINNSEFVSLARDARVAQTANRAPLIDSQPSGPRRHANR